MCWSPSTVRDGVCGVSGVCAVCRKCGRRARGPQHSGIDRVSFVSARYIGEKYSFGCDGDEVYSGIEGLVDDVDC